MPFYFLHGFLWHSCIMWLSGLWCRAALNDAFHRSIAPRQRHSRQTRSLKLKLRHRERHGMKVSLRCQPSSAASASHLEPLHTSRRSASNGTISFGWTVPLNVSIVLLNRIWNVETCFQSGPGDVIMLSYAQSNSLVLLNMTEPKRRAIRGPEGEQAVFKGEKNLNTHTHTSAASNRLNITLIF